MEDNRRKHNRHVEINDLIDDAVNNAFARRNEALSTLRDEEAASVVGGKSLPTIHGVVINPQPPVEPPVKPPIVHGVIIKPPIVHGVVINPKPSV